MKIRTGFVSNSSSTSFCFRGIRLSVEEVLELFPNKVSEFLEDQEISEIDDCATAADYIRDWIFDDKILGKYGIVIDNDIDNVLFGYDIESMYNHAPMTMTLKQLDDKLNEIFNAATSKRFIPYYTTEVIEGEN